MKESFCDVLIIGAGPAGVMAANALAREGINVRMVDKRPAHIIAGQADGIQPRTIEVLQSYGLADKLLAEGAQLHTMAYYNPSPDGKGVERTSRAPDVNAPTARYPFKITLSQTAIENLFLESMAKHGLEVERPVIPTSLQISDNEDELNDPRAYPVKVTLRRLSMEDAIPLAERQAKSNVADSGIDLSTTVPEDEEHLNAKYVLGTDGAHSWVRNELGIKLEGEHTKHVWAVVDCVPVTNFPDIRNRVAIHSNNGSCMIIPREGDLVRLYVQLAGELDLAKGGRLDRSVVTPKKIMEVAKKSMAPFQIDFPTEPKWWTVYIISQRVATQFSKQERVFIAGDACHTHSPKAGLGMNASMNDTHNLAWKLIHVIKGWAKPTLLQTYELERKKFAQDLIAFDRKLADMFSGKAVTQPDGEGVSHEDFQRLLQSEGGFTSGIGIQYQPSIITNPASQTSARGLVVGMRVPPQVILRVADCRPYQIHDLLRSDATWKLLFFVGDAKKEKCREAINRIGEYLQHKSSIRHRYSAQDASANRVFTILTIAKTSKDEADYTDIHPGLRAHWSSVYTDDIAVDRRSGGEAYAAYGVDESFGAIAAIRPDGYVGYVSTLVDVLSGGLDQYFSNFMRNDARS